MARAQESVAVCVFEIALDAYNCREISTLHAKLRTTIDHSAWARFLIRPVSAGLILNATKAFPVALDERCKCSLFITAIFVSNFVAHKRLLSIHPTHRNQIATR